MVSRVGAVRKYRKPLIRLYRTCRVADITTSIPEELLRALQAYSYGAESEDTRRGRCRGVDEGGQCHGTSRAVHCEADRGGHARCLSAADRFDVAGVGRGAELHVPDAGWAGVRDRGVCRSGVEPALHGRRPAAELHRPGNACDGALSVHPWRFHGDERQVLVLLPGAVEYQGTVLRGHLSHVHPGGRAAGPHRVRDHAGLRHLARRLRGVDEQCRGTSRQHPDRAYRANAAAAKYSRVVAAQVYGTSVRPARLHLRREWRRVPGVGRGGEHRGVWDGSVPMVPGVPNAIPNFQAAQVVALRVLHDKLPQIADAMEPGGSGNPYAGLTRSSERPAGGDPAGLPASRMVAVHDPDRRLVRRRDLTCPRPGPDLRHRLLDQARL